MEFTLIKKELSDLKTNFASLSEKYEILEKKYDECRINTKTTFKCNNCDEVFVSLGDLKKHRKRHNSNQVMFQCDECERNFKEEWKLNAHIKSHEKYSCDHCDKRFKFQDIRDKHVKIAHESLKIYCHFFNNGKTCPFNDECVFLHEDAEICKYGAQCERNNCMFKHENDTNNDNDANDVNEEDGVDEEGYDEDDNNHDETDLERTFSNPLLQTEESESNKIEVLQFRVYGPCRDLYLRNDQDFYWKELEAFSEIEKIEHLYVHSKRDYQVGTYLEIYIKLSTRFSHKMKNDQAFRQNIWDRLNIKETCPN